MIDLHSHILPGIDDGAQTLSQTVEMCRLAAADGCEAIVATPHQRRGSWWNGDRGELEALHRDVVAAVGPAPRVLLGGEIHVDSQLLAEVELLPGGGLLPLAGSRYLLLELDSTTRGGDPLDLVHELVVAGWRPILAHPEFISWLGSDLGLLAQLVARGALLQVTAMSVTGEFGKRAQQKTHAMLDAGIVHFVASDSHGVDWRPPGLKKAFQTIAARWGTATARRLTIDNPGAVVEDRPLPTGALLG